MLIYTAAQNYRRTVRPATSRATLRALFYSKKGICTYCKRKTEPPRMLPRTRHDLTATIDHFIPISKGGEVRGLNCVLACYGCNNLKGNMDPEDWVEFMKDHPNWWEMDRKPRVSQREVWRGVCPVMLACSNALYHERYKNRGIFKPSPVGQTP